MTYEQKADFLRLYTDNTVKLHGLALEVERWRQIAESTGANMDGMPRGAGTGGKVENAAVNAAAIVREIELEIEAAYAERQQVKEIIQTVPRRKRQILELHYINGMRPGDIANQYGKSEKWIRQMLRDAVNSLNI